MASDTASLQNTPGAAKKKLQQFLEFLKRHLPIIFSVLTVVMIILAGLLVYLLVTQTFLHEFTCAYMIDRNLLGSEAGLNGFRFCEGVRFKTLGFDVSGPQTIGPIHIPKIWFEGLDIPIIPGLSFVNKPLQIARLFVAWNIVIVFAVVSVVLTYIAVKVKDFVKTLMEPEGRKKILENISIYLFIFAVISGLFYFTIVVNH